MHTGPAPRGPLSLLSEGCDPCHRLKWERPLVYRPQAEPELRARPPTGLAGRPEPGVLHFAGVKGHGLRGFGFLNQAVMSLFVLGKMELSFLKKSTFKGAQLCVQSLPGGSWGHIGRSWGHTGGRRVTQVSPGVT